MWSMLKYLLVIRLCKKLVTEEITQYRPTALGMIQAQYTLIKGRKYIMAFMQPGCVCPLWTFW